MEKLLTDFHGMETLAILLALNVLTTVGKFLFKLFEKKNDQTEKNHKAIAEKTHHLAERMEHLNGSVEHLNDSVEHLRNVISSYMETTINFASKVGSVEKQLMNSTENIAEIENQIGKMSRYDEHIRKFMHAIKWLAGDDWDELKETILKDDYRE